MKILHTSDWHIGRTLHTKKRYDEYKAFLNWLAETIEREGVNALLIAGDVFDTGTPSNRAQELYYEFLSRVAHSNSCRHIVVTAGNHDSPTFLDAPRRILQALHVHVIGLAVPLERIEEEAEVEREVLSLRDTDGETELLVCAVPYLRDRDIRTSEAGETPEDKQRKMVEGIRRHYAGVCALAERKRQSQGVPIPIVAMGHLFAAGGQTIEGDGVRDLYVGSLAQVGADVFPDSIDYLALGHLHVPQKVHGSEILRYSGSPLPMGFGEAGQEKSVCLVEFSGREASVETLPVPVFQRLERVRGDWEKIAARLEDLKAENASVWVEVGYEGSEIIGNLRERLEELVAGNGIEILCIRNNQIQERALCSRFSGETLDTLDVYAVFERRLEVERDLPEEQRRGLMDAYREIMQALKEQDVQAE
jgi:exonuclease SbcD